MCGRCDAYGDGYSSGKASMTTQGHMTDWSRDNLKVAGLRESPTPTNIGPGH